MKIWSIKFSGFWPVGSAAIVCTSDRSGSDNACALFRAEWRVKYPMADPEPVEAELLNAAAGSVHILCDGNY